MSRATPRKTRHRRQPSNLIAAISDYESDAAMINQDYAPPPPTRTNTDLNLSVLQRYIPSIHSILSIAANAVIYTYDNEWVKSGIEGTLFVCAQSPLPGDAENRPRACVFVLSRRSLDNVVVDLAKVSHVEITGEFVILKVDGDWAEGEQILGIWIHNDKEQTREINGAMIQESWKVARMAGTVEEQGTEAGPATQAIGRSLTLNELFASQAAS